MTSAKSGQHTTALFGLFGVGNIGNEASLESALHALQRFSPESHPIVVCAHPDVVAAQHHVETVAISMSGAVPSFEQRPKAVRLAMRPLVELARWVAALRFVRSVDRIVIPGTGILDDFGERPRGMPYDLFRWTTVARMARTPLSFVAVGAGPIDNPTSQKLFRQAVLNATSCTYRDEDSRAFMEQLGVTTGKDAVKPDVVLGLPRPSTSEVLSGPSSTSSPEPSCIGVGMMAYYGWNNDPQAGSQIFDEYVDKMRQIAVGLLDQGFAIRLLVGEQTDTAAVEALQVGLSATAGADRVIVEPIRSFSDLLDQVGRCDAVVASRYHNVVAAMMMNRATVSLGYAEKNRALLGDADLGQFAFRIEDINGDEILASVDAALANRTAIAQTLADWNEQNVRLIDAHFETVLESGAVSG